MLDLITWWQTLPTHIDPVLFSLGPISVRWYGLMYIVAFLVVYILVRYRVNNDELVDLPKGKKLLEHIDNIFTWALIGVLLGGRLGYILFYSFETLWINPLSIIWPFQSGQFVGIAGMSFHGGLIGVVLAFYFYTKSNKINFWKFASLFIPAIPLGYTFGRLGNWLNGELWGRVTTSKIGQFFPQALDEALRHPSQLYEAIGEGLILFAVLWPLRNKLKPAPLLGLYLLGYSIARFVIEFFRQPDAHLGFVVGSLSMGQILSLAMLIAGITIFAYRSKR